MFYFNSFNSFKGKITVYHLAGIVIGAVLVSYLKFRLGLYAHIF